MTTAADYRLHGFDVSHWQAGDIDFKAGGRVFCHIKATESHTYVDPTFASKRDDAHAEGMVIVGLYHFAKPTKPTKSSARAQAEHFLRTVGDLRAHEVLVLDFEDVWDEAWAVEFIARCQATGATVIFYSYRAQIVANPHDAIKATGAPLWVARYTSDAAKADVPGWPWTMWQHTNGKTAADGPYDCSVFHTNSLAELAALAGAANPGDDDMPGLLPDERAVLDAINVRTDQLVAVAHRDIDTLQPLIEQVLQRIKDDPGSGTGAGDVDPEAFVAALKDALVKGTA